MRGSSRSTKRAGSSGIRRGRPSSSGSGPAKDSCRATRSSACPTSWASTRRCRSCFLKPTRPMHGSANPIRHRCSADARHSIACSRGMSPTSTWSGNISMQRAAAGASALRTLRTVWRPSHRLIPSRFPPVSLFDRVVDPKDLEAVYALESLTNDRIRDEAGDLRLVPRNERIAGSGTTPVMAAFTHLNPEGSRFSDGTWGVFYAAHSVATAVEETVYHRERFLAATAEPACDIEMRCYRTSIQARLHDLRGGWKSVHDPHSYVAGVAMARRLRGEGSDGIVYDSVRHHGGECVAVFYPDRVAPCVQAQHLMYRWDGRRIAQVLTVDEWKRA